MCINNVHNGCNKLPSLLGKLTMSAHCQFPR